MPPLQDYYTTIKWFFYINISLSGFKSRRDVINIEKNHQKGQNPEGVALEVGLALEAV